MAEDPSPRPSPPVGEGVVGQTPSGEGVPGFEPKLMPITDKEAGRIILDSRTTLAGTPPEAWDSRLGNRSALEWILDQYKEKVIDLLARVTTVSVRTKQIVSQMRAMTR